MDDFTRFRAYQLGTKGSLCSYAVDSDFTLIEARLNDKSVGSLLYELNKARCETIETLHITSWDEDHCNSKELAAILKHLKPRKIEYPGYKPDTDNAKNALRLIQKYIEENETVVNEPIADEYIKALPTGKLARRNNVLYNPIEIGDNHNDNSIAQLFRYGRFTVLSLGDCEASDIANEIMSCEIASKEVDVLILAHHGADNGFTTHEFLSTINPSVAICTSDRGNMYGHPGENVRRMLSDCHIPLYTTKDGDVLITCGSDNVCHVYNMIGENKEIKNRMAFTPKYTLN